MTSKAIQWALAAAFVTLALMSICAAYAQTAPATSQPFGTLTVDGLMVDGVTEDVIALQVPMIGAGRTAACQEYAKSGTPENLRLEQEVLDVVAEVKPGSTGFLSIACVGMSSFSLSTGNIPFDLSTP